MTAPENTGDLQVRGRFKPGQSGNVRGRPRGARNRATLAAEVMLDGEARKLTRKAVKLALGGDVAALRLTLERILPRRKDRLVEIDLPEIRDHVTARAAREAALGAAARGDLTFTEASRLCDLIDRVAGASSSSPADGPIVRHSGNFVQIAGPRAIVILPHNGRDPLRNVETKEIEND